MHVVEARLGIWQGLSLSHMQLWETKPDLSRAFEDYHVDLFPSDGDG